ncbi:MAG: pantoate--beta-alanine ligase [bacterium (Candidatus Stahlbacteria) CG23_combo_of_CG06-09_8_20_14_all_34_7]|nr:MAG: pantoate--beta-alanine ligase [bacterium (Candidatus Stahlbacteria) CG23_combo_of_CG06-09_8_20_14_all_34_7]
MKTIGKINRIIKERELLKSRNLTIGFVPTMGYLHNGHISLVRKAKSISDRVIVSIFINPIQFGKNEDLSKYPRSLESDKKKLDEEKVDILFYPSQNEMYKDRITKVSAIKYRPILCEKTRPDHFDGVLTVVAKLFNIISPDFAFFGEKDFQQLFLVTKMTKDLNFNLKIIPCPIVREKDKLAMSSRNVYLSSKERSEAPIIYNTLLYAKKLFVEGVEPKKIEEIAKKLIEENSSGKVDYIKIYDGKTLDEVSENSRDYRIFAAVWFGKTRLIDNIRVIK